jgi:hypothetical protein
LLAWQQELPLLVLLLVLLVLLLLPPLPPDGAAQESHPCPEQLLHKPPLQAQIQLPREQQQPRAVQHHLTPLLQPLLREPADRQQQPRFPTPV